VASLALLAACGKDTVQPPANDLNRNCSLKDLPLAGTTDGPILTYAALECQGAYINVLATAVDPQGDTDLQNVVQRIRVFEESDCTSTFRDVTDDFVASGVEESFGIVFEQGPDPAVFARICAASSWPIEVELSDASGDTITAQVLATVIH
jgi:hypothetical protein